MYGCITEAMRTLFAGDVLAPVVLRGWIAAAAIAVIGVALGTRGMRHSNT
jgi:ABC-2 type transport system permease protein